MPYLNGQYYPVGMRRSVNTQAVQAVQAGPRSAPPAPWFVWNGSGWSEDPNLRALYEENERQKQMLPIMADLQKSREANATEAAIADARLQSSWAEGGRELGFRGQESAAERGLRQFLQANEFGYRGREAAADRAFDMQKLGVADEQARARMALEQQYGLENTAVSQDFTGEQNLLARIQAERLAKMGHGMDLERMAVEKGYQSARDQDLAELKLDELAVTNKYGRKNMFDEADIQAGRDMWIDDKTRARDDRLFGQQLQRDEMTFDRQSRTFDRQSARYDDKETGAFVLDDAKAAKTALLRILPLLDEPGRRKAEELLSRHAETMKGSLRGGQLPAAMAAWMKMVGEAQLEDRIRPNPPPGDLYKTETFLDPDTGVRMQRDANGGYSPVFPPAKAPDTTSGGMPGGRPPRESDRFWDDEKARSGYIRQFTDMHNARFPDQPVSAEAAWKGGFELAKMTDRMRGEYQQEQVEQKARPVREMLQQLVEDTLSGRKSNVIGLLPQAKAYAEANGLDLDALYQDELGKAQKRKAETGSASPGTPRTWKAKLDAVDASADPTLAALKRAGNTEPEVANYNGFIVPVARTRAEVDKMRSIVPVGELFLAINENGETVEVRGMAGPVETKPPTIEDQVLENRRRPLPTGPRF